MHKVSKTTKPGLSFNCMKWPQYQGQKRIYRLLIGMAYAASLRLAVAPQSSAKHSAILNPICVAQRASIQLETNGK
jgi:hypothetical protein